jgi:hypothetical protein
MSKFMKQPFLCAALIALGVGAAVANPTFQDKKPDDPKPAPAPQKGGEKGEKGDKKDGQREKAKAAPVIVTTPMSIPLTGVTADNASKAQAAVQAVAHPLWKCTTCDHTQEEKGQCPKCKSELTLDKNGSPALKTVTVDGTSGAMQLTLAPGQNLHMGELERALKPLSITVNTRQLVVPNYSRLFISAPVGAKEGEEAIERALAGTKLFTSASVHYNEHRKEFVALVQTAGTATFADAAGAIEKCGKDYKTVDVAWTAPCASCAKAGSVQASCKNCWKE